jgi:mRNA interferase MazF
VICERWQTIAVPFPFMERPAMKRRPALIMSHRAFNEANNHTIMAMITSAMLDSWASDCAIKDLKIAGLMYPCVIRWKLFTLPNDLIVKILGELGDEDKRSVRAIAESLFCSP